VGEQYSGIHCCGANPDSVFVLYLWAYDSEEGQVYCSDYVRFIIDSIPLDLE
jgi:hypothetical protein